MEATSTSENSEPCPTPLEWRQVLAEFRAQREMIELETAGGRLTATAFGSGRPLYFVSPPAGSHEQFALVAWLLKDEFRCVFVDYRSLSAQSPFAVVRRDGMLQRLAGDVTRVAEQLGHHSISLCGISFGALVALQLLLDEPESVEATMLICGYAERRFSWLERGLLGYGALLPGTLGALPGWRRLQEQNHRPWFPPFDTSRWEFLRDDLAATPTSQLARRLSIADGVDLRSSLARVSTPILLVRTEGEGRALTACQDELETALPNVRSEWMHSTGQFPHLTHPHRVAKLARTFFAETVVQSAPVASPG